MKYILLCVIAMFTFSCSSSSSSMNNDKSSEITDDPSFVYDEGRSMMLALTCTGCHGTVGKSTTKGIPTIAGMNAMVLLAELEAFKSGKRESAVMELPVKGFSSEELKQIAVHFSRHK